MEAMKYRDSLTDSLQSIHADIAYTLAKYLESKLRPDRKTTPEDMNITNLVMREGLVAQKNTTVPQLIQVSITTADIDSGTASLEWHNLTNDGQSLVGGEDVEPIVTSQVLFGRGVTTCPPGSQRGTSCGAVSTRWYGWQTRAWRAASRTAWRACSSRTILLIVRISTASRP